VSFERMPSLRERIGRSVAEAMSRSLLAVLRLV